MTLRRILNRNLQDTRVEKDSEVKKTPLRQEKGLIRAGHAYGTEGNVVQLHGSVGEGQGRWKWGREADKRLLLGEARP